jgi:hypothetical protein
MSGGRRGPQWRTVEGPAIAFAFDFAVRERYGLMRAFQPPHQSIHPNLKIRLRGTIRLQLLVTSRTPPISRLPITNPLSINALAISRQSSDPAPRSLLCTADSGSSVCQSDFIKDLARNYSILSPTATRGQPIISCQACRRVSPDFSHKDCTGPSCRRDKYKRQFVPHRSCTCHASGSGQLVLAPTRRKLPPRHCSTWYCTGSACRP